MCLEDLIIGGFNDKVRVWNFGSIQGDKRRVVKLSNIKYWVHGDGIDGDFELMDLLATVNQRWTDTLQRLRMWHVNGTNHTFLINYTILQRTDGLIEVLQTNYKKLLTLYRTIAANANV